MKRQPTRLGNILKEDYLKPLSITIQALTSILGVSGKILKGLMQAVEIIRSLNQNRNAAVAEIKFR